MIFINRHWYKVDDVHHRYKYKDDDKNYEDCDDGDEDGGVVIDSEVPLSGPMALPIIQSGTDV